MNPCRDQLRDAPERRRDAMKSICFRGPLWGHRVPLMPLWIATNQPMNLSTGRIKVTKMRLVALLPASPLCDGIARASVSQRPLSARIRHQAPQDNIRHPPPPQKLLWLTIRRVRKYRIAPIKGFFFRPRRKALCISFTIYGVPFYAG
jgi:hypothetical protein